MPAVSMAGLPSTAPFFRACAAILMGVASFGGSLPAARAEVRAEPERPEKGEAEVAFEGGFPVTRRDQIFRLEEVKRGQRGVGYTVFEADRAEPFGVEILGVMEGMLGPGEDVVLARLTGDQIAFTGVIAGMSGSPVYIDGRLLGAVAYRFGSFAKEPIAGITPIERMLPLLERDEGGTAGRGRIFSGPAGTPVAVGPELGRAPRTEPQALVGSELFRGRPASASGAPILTPISASGLHPGALARLEAALAPAGFAAMASGHGPERGSNGPSRAGAVPAAPILPGAPVAALLTRGDINLSAIGTVTFVDETQVLGFGHPFVGQGSVAFPLATAAILNTLASDAGSYKQGLAAREVGVVSQDRLTAISGRLGGPQAELVPVRVTVIDEGLRTPDRTAVEVVHSPVWLPMLTDAVVSSSVLKRIGAEAGGTVDMKAGIEVNGRYLEVSDTFAAPSPTKVAAYASRDVAQLVAIVSRNGFEEADVTGVRVEMRLSPEVRLWDIESVRLQPARARPGETVKIEARLRPYRGKTRTVELALRIPDDAGPGKAEVFVGGGLELDHRDAAARGSLDPSSLDGLLGLLADRRPAAALYARLYLPQDGLRLGAEVYADLPPSLRATIGSHPALDAEPIAEAPGPEVSTPLPGVVSGGSGSTLEILPAYAAQEKPAR